jgi:Ca2+-binding RTX toxin-like protein
MVLAIGAGYASITVTTVEGGFTKQSTATVVVPSIFKSISFYPPYVQLYTNSSIQSNVVFNPRSASNTPVVYTSNDPRIASVNTTGLVTALGTENNDSIDFFNFLTARALTIFGDVGNDTIVGSGANDTIDGGDGNDRITGGLGGDILIGQDGAHDPRGL